jgi:hypothetical protein
MAYFLNHLYVPKEEFLGFLLSSDYFGFQMGFFHNKSIFPLKIKTIYLG